MVIKNAFRASRVFKQKVIACDETVKNKRTLDIDRGSGRKTEADGERQRHTKDYRGRGSKTEAEG